MNFFYCLIRKDKSIGDDVRDFWARVSFLKAHEDLAPYDTTHRCQNWKTILEGEETLNFGAVSWNPLIDVMCLLGVIKLGDWPGKSIRRGTVRRYIVGAIGQHGRDRGVKNLARASEKSRLER